MIVPAVGYLISPHVVRTAVDDHIERIFFILVEVRRQSDKIMDIIACLALEPELPERLPIYCCDALAIKFGQGKMFFSCCIYSDYLNRIYGAAPVGKYDRRRGLFRDR